MCMIWLILAVAFLCAAHFLRMKRWRLFVEIYEQPKEDVLLSALSIGYMVNFILPFKLGDLIRTWIAGRRMQNAMSFSLSTVIMDRYLDIIMVGTLFLLFFAVSGGNTQLTESVLFYGAAALALLVISVLAFYCSSLIKWMIRKAAAIFNEKIEYHILRFAYSMIRNFKDLCTAIDKRKILGVTIAMWSGYLVSYYCFAMAVTAAGIQAGWMDVFLLFFSKNTLDMGTMRLAHSGGSVWLGFPMLMAVYCIVPLFLLWGISFGLKKYQKNESRENGGRYILPHAERKDRLLFLEDYFSNEHRDYLAGYIKVNQDIVIIRDYSAGSRATTLLCSDKNGTFFRKYAFGEEGMKLQKQVEWLKKYTGRLSVPEILRNEYDEKYCFYDMPYRSEAMSFFQYVHIVDAEESKRMLLQILGMLEEKLYNNSPKTVDKQVLRLYIEDKVKGNLEKLLKHKQIAALEKYDTLWINGTEVSTLHQNTDLLNGGCLLHILEKDTQQPIHGDLTAENIICVKEMQKEDWFYFIDPNAIGSYQSETMDYGKLLQSLHGGYEFLMKSNMIDVSQNQVNFLFAKSEIYETLYRFYAEWLKAHFDPEKVKRIFIHEMIHWFRLMPYKLERDSNLALLCYARLLLILRDIRKEFDI